MELLHLHKPLDEEPRELVPVGVQQREVLHEFVAEVRVPTLRLGELFLPVRHLGRVLSELPRLLQLALVRIHVQHVVRPLIHALLVGGELLAQLSDGLVNAVAELFEARRAHVLVHDVHDLHQLPGALHHRPPRICLWTLAELNRRLRQGGDVRGHRLRRVRLLLDRRREPFTVRLDLVEQELLSLHPGPEELKVLVGVFLRPAELHRHLLRRPPA
mmetsp:Transcript_2828/g.11136  ORF Transcript_2828/g.11136 Transcript_2828/m.11136 type:complete len:216 (-) Transcript_2828:722-1369(-)